MTTVKKTIEKYGLVIATLSIVIIYLPITQKYFEQDEWHNFGWWIYNLGKGGFWHAFQAVIASNIPFTQLFNFVNYYLFGVQNFVPAIVVLVLIVLNSYLWYKNIFLISKSKLVATVSLFFGYSSFIASQAVTWVIPAFANQAAFLFINLSIYFLLRFSNNHSKKHGVLCTLSALLALTSKFNSFFIIVLLPVIYLLETAEQRQKRYRKRVLAFLLLLFIIGTLVFTTKVGHIEFEQGRLVENSRQALLNIFYLPTKSISQILIPNPSWIFHFSDFLMVNRYNLQQNDALAQSLVTEQISVILSLIVILMFIILLPKLSPRYKKIILFALSIYFLSFMPLILDRFSTGTGLLESRHYFIGAFSFGIFVGMLIDFISKKISIINSRPIRITSYSILMIITLLLLQINISLLRREINRSIEITQKRKEILEFAKNEFAHRLQKDFILYVEDINYPNTALTNITGSFFQTGFLYPFLVYSYDSGKIPYEAFSDEELFVINFQGTKMFTGHTIGLYYDYTLLKQFLQSSEFNIDDVYALRFDYRNVQSNPKATGHFHDIRFATYENITDQVRQRIASGD